MSNMNHLLRFAASCHQWTVMLLLLILALFRCHPSLPCDIRDCFSVVLLGCQQCSLNTAIHATSKPVSFWIKTSWAKDPLIPLMVLFTLVKEQTMDGIIKEGHWPNGLLRCPFWVLATGVLSSLSSHPHPLSAPEGLMEGRKMQFLEQFRDRN